MDVPDAQYTALKGLRQVDVRMVVDDLRTLLAAQLGVHPSLVPLRLAWCGSCKPTAEEEAAAAALDDPSLSLAAVGVKGAAWLLVDVLQPTRLAAEREEVAERQRVEREEEAERQRAERRARRGARPYCATPPVRLTFALDRCQAAAGFIP